MRVPWSWLREYCDPGLGVEALAERLSMTGTEVERISHAGAPSADGFVVGRVLAVERHPDADRLSVCEVDTGEGSRTIVCGAPNVAAGQTVPVALPGAVMPGGRQLGRAELRGVVSDGMILSEAELEIGDDAAGIAVLAEDGAGPDPGTPLIEVLPVSEPVLELEVTPNRPDCLGVYGVAREVHAVTGAPLAEPPWARDASSEGQGVGEGEVGDYASVSVEAPELCPRFTARVFTDVRIGPSPLWLKGLLRAAGQRPINNVVDITNYAMLTCSQPLHAFDLDRVPGGELIVRTAREGERMTTLDGVERSFDPSMVLVCDREGPSGIAGIMGGARSEVSDATTRVLLEVATWNGVNILQTSSRLGLRSEASARFEKQLHPELAMRGQRIAARLLVELCGARMVPGTIDVAAAPPRPRVIDLRTARAEGLLGLPIAPRDQAEYLERLDYAVEPAAADLAESAPAGETLTVTVPADRHYDTTREADLVEEVARVHGLDEHLPAALPQHSQAGRLDGHQRLRRRVEDALRDLGFIEVITWSYTDRTLDDRLRLAAGDPRRARIRIHNPLSEDGSLLRTTLLGGLLDATRHNLAHGAGRVALFESGRVYLREAAAEAGGGVLAGDFAGERPAPAAEPHRLAALAVGPLRPTGWSAGGSRGDREQPYFGLKGVLEVVFAGLGADARFEATGEPFLHPGRAAAIELAGAGAGWIGELHPRVSGEWDLPGAVAFEIDLAALEAAATTGAEQYEDVVSFPAVYQDIAVVAPEEVTAERIHHAVRAAGGDLLRSATVFDLYRGEQVGEGRRSLALRLEFRARDRTLTDAEVAEVRERIKAGLGEIGGSLRE